MAAIERGEVDAMPFFDSLREVKRLRRQNLVVTLNKVTPVSAPRLGGLQHRQEAVRRRAGLSGGHYARNFFARSS